MRRDLGILWHALAGAAIGAAASALGIPSWVTLPTLAAFGTIREIVQHDLKLTRHQWLEALAWPSGGGIGVLGVALFA